ncbi:MAG: CpsD/CapB family tyrosine-protein kinase [Clostridiaceae bacterium]|jgi:capsular exopolysaccharide synthesis family protein|nr:CpsD/CapB family tyrosine-protein kinase [Clostridiaceae bacterium]
MKLAGKGLTGKREEMAAKKQTELLKSNMARIISNTDDFATVESYRAARTNIMFSIPDEKNCKRIIVTSAMQGDGKTTIAINLALMFAKTGSKVLLIDADLRLPMVNSYLDIANGKGLSNILIGQSNVEDVIVKKFGIDIITAGGIPPNPAELLDSDAMRDLIYKLSDNYDYIFIDTPPVGIMIDAMSALKVAHGVVLVVRQNYTLHKAVQAAVETLEFAKAKIFGFILNDSELIRYHYKRKKNSKYNYHYNYNYYGNQKKRNA